MSYLSSFIGGFPPAQPGDIRAFSIYSSSRTSGVFFATSSTSYIEAFWIPIIVPGAYRIRFRIQAYTGGTAYGRIYRNGVAVGTERSVGDSPVTFSEDISGWSFGDRLSLYLKARTSSDAAYFLGLSLGVNNPRLVMAYGNFGYLYRADGNKVTTHSLSNC